jgi:hypothetical protein
MPSLPKIVPQLCRAVHEPPSRALGLYGIVGAAIWGGVGLAATNIDHIAMLFWTAVINGIVAVPIMIAMMVVASTGSRIRSLSLPLWLKLLGGCGGAHDHGGGNVNLV